LERRLFYFRETALADCPPRYLSLAAPAGTPCLPPDGWNFNPDVLEACAAQTPEWKRRHGFPLEIDALVRLDSAALPSAPPGECPPETPNQLPPWQRILIDRAERMGVVLILAEHGGEAEKLLGFAVQPQPWTLQAAEPVLALGSAWGEVFPELTGDVLEERWWEAWRAWCHPRSLPEREVEACTLRHTDHRLLVTAPRELIERLRASRSDALRGDAWLLAGSGSLRPAAQVELIEAV
jgi:hypothetical protein